MPTATTRTLLIALTLAALATPTGAVAAQAEGAKEAANEAPAETSASAVSLGEYSIRDLRTVEGTTLRINFQLYASVDADEAKSAVKEVEEHQHRIRNEVLIAIRLCEQHEFQEPDLDRVRRRILARLNRALPNLPIEKLLVGEFEYFND